MVDFLVNHTTSTHSIYGEIGWFLTCTISFNTRLQSQTTKVLLDIGNHGQLQ